MRSDNKKILVISLIVMFVIVGTVGIALRGSAMYYVEIGELLNSSEDGVYRVIGDIRLGSTNKSSNLITFEMLDNVNKSAMLVSYGGVVPDAYKEGQEAVVEGRYDKATKTFVANKVLIKCPSKYEVNDK